MSFTIDMHCDSLMAALFREGPTADVFDCPEQALDIKRLLEGKAMAQFFAIFIPPEEAFQHMKYPVSAPQYIEECAQVFENTIKRHSDVVAKACSAEDVERNWKDGKLSAILTMEDGVEVHGDMAKLDHFYDLGVRALTLTWNFENCFGAPNSKDPLIMNKGLTDFGKEAVKHMQELGMLVDVSHVSDAVFWDVCKIAKVPFIASHSNARSIACHTRNMTDDMIKELHKHGGCMGINFLPAFLNDTPGFTESRIEDMVAMAVHEKEIAGVDVIAIGTDFDGMGGDLEIPGPQKMNLLFDALIRAGFSVEEVDKIAYGNVLRVMKEAMR
ncbi:MAG: dipeptidase [Erysipelotrichaceae bacterium]|nr:dipeptidase [Erysipelotrichaceae bacterium]